MDVKEIQIADKRDKFHKIQAYANINYKYFCSFSQIIFYFILLIPFFSEPRICEAKGRRNEGARVINKGKKTTSELP